MVNDSVTQVHSFDGQTIWSEKNVALYEVGNFLGGGAAGTVYEAEHVTSKDHFAVKILNPLGYKLLSPTLLRRCTVVSKGKAVYEKPGEKLSEENVWWLLNGGTKQYVAACFSDRSGLRELSLNQCIDIWGTSPKKLERDPKSALAHNGAAVPAVPAKFAEFVLRRDHIFREITNMRKISAHHHVIRLESVLELAQESKCTIFLVMELANGGELFDRIKLDCGTREDTARLFFRQVLEGVSHCHAQGVCHRDLKPENLLLSDGGSGAIGTILKIADFGFSARIAMDCFDAAVAGGSYPAATSKGGRGGGAVTPSLTLTPADSPLRMLKSVVGSPFYVAPEVIQASAGYDGVKADVWSLGVILYAMLAGNLPFLQDLSTCKRFKSFVKWVLEAEAQAPVPDNFWAAPDLEFPSWLFPSKFSLSARGLIVMMLHPDPLRRFSVRDAQRHPFVTPTLTPAPSAPVPAPPVVAATVVASSTVTSTAREAVTAALVAQQQREIAPPLELVATRMASDGALVVGLDGEPVSVATACPSPMDKGGVGEGGADAAAAAEATAVVRAVRAAQPEAVASPAPMSRNSDSMQSMDQQEHDADDADVDDERFRASSCADDDLFLMDVEGDAGGTGGGGGSGGGKKKAAPSEGVFFSGSIPRSPSAEVTKKLCLEEGRAGMGSAGGSASNSPSIGGTWQDCEGEGDAAAGVAAAEPRRLSSLFSAAAFGTRSVPPTPPPPPAVQSLTPFPGGIARSQTVGLGVGIAAARGGGGGGGIGAGFAGLPERAHTTGSGATVRSAPMEIAGIGGGDHGAPRQQPSQASSFSASKFAAAGSAGATGFGSSLGSAQSQMLLAASCPQPPLAPLMLRQVADLLGAADEMEVSSSTFGSGATPVLSAAASKIARTSSGGSGPAAAVPPSFHEIVKRSTRFVTTVPALDVLLKVEQLLQNCCAQRTMTPIGLVGKVAVSWEHYRLDVWAHGDVAGCPVCSLQLYQYQAPEHAVAVGQSPPGGYIAVPGQSPGPPPAQYLVEFIRQGTLEIFMFKRFYQWIRQQLVEDLMKIRDYGSGTDQFVAGSPMAASSYTSRFMHAS